ncbi:hypothetical protein Btru_037540 [Bulinus truncatus]|nr:hypothetical protein Btru_037540 [Bulinus truncatus]
MPQSICSFLQSIRRMPVDYRQICIDVGDEVKSGACGGDSGSALSCKIRGRYYLAGIVSFGTIDCSSERYPGVFTRIYEYIDWILSNVDYDDSKDHLINKMFFSGLAYSDDCHYVGFDEYPIDLFRRVYYNFLGAPFHKDFVRSNSSAFLKLYEKFKRAQCGELKVDPGWSIIGGRASNSFPWTVNLITQTGSQICGGVLISSDWVLTTAHCLDSPNDVVAVIDGNHRDIQYLIRHKEFTETDSKNDIALIKLDSPVCSFGNLMPVCLPLIDYDFEYSQFCYVTGWGVYQKHGTESSPEMRQLRVSVLPQSICSFSYALVKLGADERNICVDAGDMDDSGPCNGDSGGPLSCKPGPKYYVAGLTQRSDTNCTGTFLPFLFMRTSFYTQWIINTILSRGGTSFC